MANLARLEAVLIVSAVVFILGSSAAASDRQTGTVKGNDEETRFEEYGFEFIGKISADNSSGSARSTGVNSVSLYLSPPSMRYTQINAIRTCRNLLMGNLLFILTDGQYDDVRLCIEGHDGPFWTIGVYDDGFGYNGGYKWDILDLPVNPNYIRHERQCTENTIGTGLAVQGELSNFGLCGAQLGTALRFICRV